MKKILLSFFALSFIGIFSSFAQPTLTATGINPVIGEVYPVIATGYVSPGASGANQTWDLSSMQGSSTDSTCIVLPSSTINGSSFPQSNVAFTITSSTDIGYYNASSSKLQHCGFSQDSIVSVDSDLEDIMRYPCTYNNSFTDPWITQFSYGGYNFTRKGNTTITADSYGTLITPSVTYTNVMRVHLVELYQDSLHFETPYITNYTNDEYMWYKEGINIQLATVFTVSRSDGYTYSGGTYLFNNFSNEVVKFLQPQELIFNIVPNPANDQVSIEYSLTSNQNVDLRLINSMGQQVKTDYNAEGIQGINTIKLDVADLPDGIYFAQLLIDGKIAVTKRFIRSSKN